MQQLSRVKAQVLTSQWVSPTMQKIVKNQPFVVLNIISTSHFSSFVCSYYVSPWRIVSRIIDLVFLFVFDNLIYKYIEWFFFCKSTTREEDCSRSSTGVSPHEVQLRYQMERMKTVRWLKRIRLQLCTSEEVCDCDSSE